MRRVALTLLVMLSAVTLRAQFPIAISGGTAASNPSPSSPLIVTVSLPQCIVDAAFSATITATGGTGTYSSFTKVSGSYPTGSPAFALNLSSNTGALTGTPTVAESVTFVVQVTDSGGLTDTQEYNLTCIEAGSGVMRSGHPRMYFIPESATGEGNELTAWRTRINTYYSADFQSFITDVNEVATDPTGKGGNNCGAACAHGIAFAMLALADPAEMPTYAWGGRTQANYIAYAKAHALYIAGKVVASPFWDNSQDAEELISQHFPSLALPVIFDWTTGAGETWSDADKRSIIEAGINLYAGRNPRSADVFFTGGSYSWEMNALIGLAFDLSDVPSGSYSRANCGTTINQTYAAWIIEIQAAAYADFFNTDGSQQFPCNSGLTLGWLGNEQTFFQRAYDNTTAAAWAQGNSYSESSGFVYAQWIWAIASVFDTNIGTASNWWNTLGLWHLNMLRPAAMAAATSRYEWRYGVNTPHTGYESGWARHGFWVAASTSTSATFKRVMRWVAGTGYSNLSLIGTNAGADSTRIAYWPWFHFLYGMEHIGAAMSPSAAGLSTSSALGQGYTFFRSGYESEDDSLVTITAPQTGEQGGHWRNDYSAFTIEKFGALVIQGGQNKGSSDTTGGFQSESELDLAKMLVVMPGETGVYKGGFAVTYAQSGGMSIPHPGGSGYCASSQTYKCDIGSTPAYSFVGDTEDYDALRYVYTGLWNPLKVSYADRDFTFVRGATDHEYVIVVDRITAVDANYGKRWNIKLPFTPTSSAAKTTIETGAGYLNEQGGIWTAPSTTTWTMTNTAAILDVDDVLQYTSHGRLFIKSILPTGTWHQVSGDFYEQRDTAAFDPIPKAAHDIASSTAGATSTIVLTSGGDSPDNGEYVLIYENSDDNLNGYKQVTRVTSTTFTVACAPSNCSGSGTGGWMIQNTATEMGADSFGRARLEMRPSTARASDFFVTVLHFGDSNSLTSMSPVVVMCSGTVTETCSGSIAGVEVDDSTQQFIELFSTSASAAVPTMPATITPTLSGSIRVRLHNLTASTNYYYKADPAGSIEFRTSTFSGATEKATNAGGILDFTYTR